MPRACTNYRSGKITEIATPMSPNRKWKRKQGHPKTILKATMTTIRSREFNTEDIQERRLWKFDRRRRQQL